MGRGPRTKPEIELTAPIDLRNEGGDGDGEAGGSASESTSFCAREHVISFVLADESADVGEHVWLVRSNPPSVRAGNRILGELSGSDATAMASCLRTGYRVTGIIETVDSAAGSGSLRVIGEARPAA